MQYIVSALDIDSPASRQLLGGKAAALAQLQEVGLPIPTWIVLTPAAFEASLPHPGASCGDSSCPSWLAGLQSLQPAAAVREELEHALMRLSPHGELLAVRSSAREEDGCTSSFAGQLESYLAVRPADVAARVADVWRSAYSERLQTYRRERGLHGPVQPPAVLIQRMVHADAAGVAFSADPLSGRRGVALVSAVHGLGSVLVDGAADADTYYVDTSGEIIERMLAHKRVALYAAPDYPGGLRRSEPDGELAARPALDDAHVRAVAELARRAEQRFGRPQDIEWASAGGRLYLLQARPITTLASLPDPDGEPALWDNSNIAESYGGLTAPLTFSFARRAYAEVYRQFCRLMGVDEATISAQERTFQRMIGLIQGRVYYNLLSWYRMLSLLPGYTFNRRFMEQMMGVKQSLPPEAAAALAPAGRRARLRDGLRLLRSLGGLVLNYALLPRRIGQFYARLEQTLGADQPPLTQLRPDQLVALYRGIEAQLLRRWDAPIVNDFFAMIFYGLLRRLAARWCGDTQETLQNDLLCAEGGMISAEPATRVRELAGLAASHPALVAALCGANLPVIRVAMAQAPAFQERFEAYLAKFGDRCLEELKLESPTLHDDPLPLLRSVGQLARRLAATDQPPLQPQAVDRRLREAAEQRVHHSLRRHLLRRLVFRWVLRNARARVRDRENLRFERTRVFGRARALFLELGRRYYALNLLDDPRDIFYLEVDEALNFVEGTASCSDLRGLAALRRAESERWRAMAAPAERFQTRGAPAVGPFEPPRPTDPGSSSVLAEELHHETRNAQGAPELDTYHGTGCCPGLVRGRVRVITDPRGAVLEQGQILVAERTDPGWIMLFPAAAGVIVERGSLLSHSAIVARELGIPTVVGLRGATSWLNDGDWVELDGASGSVRRLPTEVLSSVPHKQVAAAAYAVVE